MLGKTESVKQSEVSFFPPSWSWSKFYQSGIICPWFDDHWIVGHSLVAKDSSPRKGCWSFYAPDFFLEDPRPWWSFQSVKCIERDQLEVPVAIMCRDKNRVWEVPDWRSFAFSFGQLQELLVKKEIEKAVPIILAQHEGLIDKVHWMQVLRKFREIEGKQRELFPYGFWSTREGMLGMTPELLVAGKGGVLTSMALAGTRRSGFTKGKLADDPKERREHQLVVNAIAAQLKDWGKMGLSDTYEWDLGQLTHLRTDFRVEVKEIKESPYFELIHQLHPTPALGAWPKARGLEWLKRNRPRMARRFGAPFGVVSPQGSFFFVVAIRNIQWHEGRSWLATGCGVIGESKVEREWEELALKRESILENLGI